MTKADYIRGLAKANPARSMREIADMTAAKFGSCSVEYARLYARQRLQEGQSDSDRRYVERFMAEHGKTPQRARRDRDPEAFKRQRARWREKNSEHYNAYHREYYHRRRRAEAAHA